MKRRENILSNWSVLIDDFNTSGQDFFTQVKERVTERAVPLDSTTVIKRSESGILSSKREYLRIIKGDLFFDIGAAPYGTGFFFSWWLLRKSPPLAWVYTAGYTILTLILATVVFGGFGTLLSLIISLIVATGILGFVGKLGILGPEEYLMQAPIIGRLYTIIFSPATYHSLDIAAMYEESIRRSINAAIDEILEEADRPHLSPDQKTFNSILQTTQQAINQSQ